MNDQDKRDDMTSEQVVDADAPADVASIIGSAESGAGDPTGAGAVNDTGGNDEMGERNRIAHEAATGKASSNN